MKRGFALLDVSLSLVICCALPLPTLAAAVATCDEAGLRAALNGGGAVTFACDGVITLSNTITITGDTVLDGTGHNVTISGGGTVRVFEVNGGVSFTAINLAIANGRSTNAGGFYNNGTLRLSNCIISNNVASALAGAAGAKGADGTNICGQNYGTNGTLGLSGEAARGGAIYNGGVLEIANSIFLGNWAQGGSGGAGGDGGRGQNLGYHSGVPECPGNGGNGAAGGIGGDARGGAVYNSGTARIDSSSFTANQAVGGTGGGGGQGGAGYQYGRGGDGAAGGIASGASLFNRGNLTISRCTLAGNYAVGGLAAKGGETWYCNTGGFGGFGGAAFGGGVWIEANASLFVTNATLVDNHAIGGDSGNGGLYCTYGCPAKAGNGGDGAGGALANAGAASLVNCTVWANSVAGGFGEHNNISSQCAGLGGPTNIYFGTNGAAVAAQISNSSYWDGTVSLLNTIVGSSNFQNSCNGAISDAGHNICSDSTAAFSAPGSQNNTDPGLGAFGANGGPTRTFALQLGSAAIDAGDDQACPPTDQRGVLRPEGPHCDIGAFEQTTSATCDEPRLRAALSGGGTIHFTCDGVITLSNTITVSNDVVLDATGHNVTISGAGRTRVFNLISSPGGDVARLTLINLTIADGKSTNGAGFYNQGGVLTLVNCILTNNVVIASNGVAGPNGPDGSTFSPPDDGKPGGPGSQGEAGRGGVICNFGLLSVTNCTFVANSVRGGNGGNGGNGGHGSTSYDQFGRPRFGGHGGNGANGGIGGGAFGGAIYNASVATVVNSSFLSDRVFAGNGGIGGNGGAGGFANLAGYGGDGGTGGIANGGAIYNDGQLIVRACAFASNQALGGTGAKGGETDWCNSGGKGGYGGAAFGGGLWNSTNASLIGTNATLFDNYAIGGDSGDGGLYCGYACPAQAGNGGEAAGGGLGNVGTVSLVNCTVWANGAAGGFGEHNVSGGQCAAMGGPNAFGTNGAFYGLAILNRNGTVSLVNTIVGSSYDLDACSGIITDGGHNICYDSSAAFNAPSSRNNTNPRLGSLAENGGPTQTLALQSDSPAIDAGDDLACPPTDQRGVPRPQGAHCDIGAFEQTFLSIRRLSDHGLQLQYVGVPGESYVLKSCVDFTVWNYGPTNTAASDGRVTFSASIDSPADFYEVIHH